jgi:hypothetical protein
MNIDNRQNIKNRKEMCNHNYLDQTNTLIGVPKLKMITPTTYYLKCKNCGEVISINRSDILNIKEFIHTFF